MLLYCAYAMCKVHIILSLVTAVITMQLYPTLLNLQNEIKHSVKGLHCYSCAFAKLRKATIKLCHVFIIQQMHKYIIRRYNLNYYKIFQIAPTCFGSQGIHHQGPLYTRTTEKYAAVTPTTSISTDAIEPLL